MRKNAPQKLPKTALGLQAPECVSCILQLAQFLRSSRRKEHDNSFIERHEAKERKNACGRAQQ
jgi:hypothetical protein